MIHVYRFSLPVSVGSRLGLGWWEQTVFPFDSDNLAATLNLISWPAGVRVFVGSSIDNRYGWGRLFSLLVVLKSAPPMFSISSVISRCNRESQAPGLLTAEYKSWLSFKIPYLSTSTCLQQTTQKNLSYWSSAELETRV